MAFQLQLFSAPGFALAMPFASAECVEGQKRVVVVCSGIGCTTDCDTRVPAAVTTGTTTTTATTGLFG